MHETLARLAMKQKKKQYGALKRHRQSAFIICLIPFPAAIDYERYGGRYY